MVSCLPNQRRCLRRYPQDHEKKAQYEHSYESLFSVLPSSAHPARDAEMLLAYHHRLAPTSRLVQPTPPPRLDYYTHYFYYKNA